MHVLIIIIKDTWYLTVCRDVQHLKAVLHSFEGLLFIFLGGTDRYPAQRDGVLHQRISTVGACGQIQQ